MALDDHIAQDVPYLAEPQRAEFARLLCDMLALEPANRILPAAEAYQRLKSATFSIPARYWTPQIMSGLGSFGTVESSGDRSELGLGGEVPTPYLM